MGTILAAAIIQRAQTLTQDLTNVRWPMDEMLRWLNSGQRQIVALRPDAGSVTDKMQLAAGTKQSIPAGGWRILKVVRNLGNDGATPGRAIRLVEMEILDAQNPDWHFMTPDSAGRVIHWTTDERDPRTWYCYPPQPSSGRVYVDLMYSRAPTNCTLKGVAGEDLVTKGTVDSVITLDDVFESPLVNYCAFRAFSKDAEYVTKGLAGSYWNLFLTGIGMQAESDRAFTPQNNAPPEVNPNVRRASGAFSQG